MNLIDEIEQRFRERYPQANCKRIADSISYVSADDSGFTVTLYAHKDGFTVHFNGWHDEFSDAAEARACFGSGLSSAYRLRELRRGHFAYHWQLQRRDGDAWTPLSEVGLLFFGSSMFVMGKAV